MTLDRMLLWTQRVLWVGLVISGTVAIVGVLGAFVLAVTGACR